MKQESKRVNVPDLRDYMKLWDLRFDILSELYTLCGFLGNMTDPKYYSRAKVLINQIESIGKKEGD